VNASEYLDAFRGHASGYQCLHGWEITEYGAEHVGLSRGADDVSVARTCTPESAAEQCAAMVLKEFAAGVAPKLTPEEWRVIEAHAARSAPSLGRVDPEKARALLVHRDKAKA
jgi:hypothetical protein